MPRNHPSRGTLVTWRHCLDIEPIARRWTGREGHGHCSLGTPLSITSDTYISNSERFNIPARHIAYLRDNSLGVCSDTYLSMCAFISHRRDHCLSDSSMEKHPVTASTNIFSPLRSPIQIIVLILFPPLDYSQTYRTSQPLQV